MNILVNELLPKTEYDNNNKNLVISKEVICPECQEYAFIKLIDYKITIYDCKNGHKTKDIFINDFENTQKIDISKIICAKCKKNKGSTYNNEFFRCCTCGINLCPLCSSCHDKTHQIINYEKNYYICEKHKDNFIKYCKKCKLNLCIVCEKEHKGHDIIYFGDIIPNKEDLEKEMNKFKKNINQFNSTVKIIIEKIINITKILKKYYYINDNIIKSYEMQKKNYQILHNINEFHNYNNQIIQDMNKMIDEKNIIDKLKILMDIDNKMNNIIYKNKRKSKTITLDDLYKSTIKFDNNDFSAPTPYEELNDKYEQKAYINNDNKAFDVQNKTFEVQNKTFDVQNKTFNATNKTFNVQNKIFQYQDKISYKFTKKPQNLKYKLEITNTNFSRGVNDIFEVFLSYKDNKEYLISPNAENYNLDIFLLKNNQKINSLKRHKSNIKTVRYFINNKNNNEYLISGDDECIVIIWDITKNYEIKYEIETYYNKYIFSCLMIFPRDKDDNYIITSTYNASDSKKDSCKIYSLNTGNFIKFINGSNKYEIVYLLSWFNKYNNKDYVVMFINKKIVINNLFEDEVYSEFIKEPENCHNSGFIFTKNNKDYLCSSSTNGYINIWDLYNKSIFKVINVPECWLMHIIQWNDEYFIVSDLKNKTFKVIDFENNKIFFNSNWEHSNYVPCAKKIFHPDYGEVLLTANLNNSIKLWTFDD